MTMVMPPNDGMTARDYKDAIDVQCAVNLSGVARSLAEVTARLGAAGLDTRARNNHPIVRMFVAELASLCGLGVNDLDVYHDAYAECIARSLVTGEVAE